MEYRLIKLGGSVITDPTKKGCFNKNNTSRLARELFSCYSGSVLIHGTGHIGKPPAIKYHYVESGIIGKKDHLIALKIKESIRRLNQRVIKELIGAGIPAIPIDILHFSEGSSEDPNSVLPEIRLKQLLSNGLVPVVYGDLLPVADGSFKVISSDYLTLVISKILNPRDVLFLTDVDGVYAKYEPLKDHQANEILPLITQQGLALPGAFGNDHRDVSGGMRKKIETALEISVYCGRCAICSGYSRLILHNFFNNQPFTGTIVKQGSIQAG